MIRFERFFERIIKSFQKLLEQLKDGSDYANAKKYLNTYGTNLILEIILSVSFRYHENVREEREGFCYIHS